MAEASSSSNNNVEDAAIEERLNLSQQGRELCALSLSGGDIHIGKAVENNEAKAVEDENDEENQQQQPELLEQEQQQKHRRQRKERRRQSSRRRQDERSSKERWADPSTKGGKQQQQSERERERARTMADSRLHHSSASVPSLLYRLHPSDAAGLSMVAAAANRRHKFATPSNHTAFTRVQPTLTPLCKRPVPRPMVSLSNKQAQVLVGSTSTSNLEMRKFVPALSPRSKSRLSYSSLNVDPAILASLPDTGGRAGSGGGLCRPLRKLNHKGSPPEKALR